MGTYYMPLDLARFIVKWGITGRKVTNILEPSCGDGIFLKCLKEVESDYNCIAVEINEKEANKAKNILQKDDRFHIVSNDFFGVYEDDLKRL